MRWGVLAASISVVLGGSIAFDDVLSMTSTLTPDRKSASFTVTAKGKYWFGFGISADGSMTSTGKGSDIIVCSSGQVQRYWVDAYGPPQNGTIVDGSECTQQEGISRMKFTRLLAATSPTERGFNLDGPTKLIYAYNTKTDQMKTKDDMHTNKGSADYLIAPTVAPTPAGAVEGFIQLNSMMSMMTDLSADRTTLSVVLNTASPGWFAVGVSTDGSMTSNGNGSDVIGCNNGSVYRYWITEHKPPVNGTLVPGATCVQIDGSSALKFTRATNATSATQLPINLAGNTSFIWAYNNDSTTITSYHGAGRGSAPFDVSNPPPATPTPAPTTPPVPTPATPTPASPTKGIYTFDSVLSMATELSADMKFLTVTLQSVSPGWLAVGVSPNGDMTNGGNGSDIIACTNNSVARYNVKAHAPPSDGVLVPNATCTQASGKSVMTFTRQTAATSTSELPINLQGKTTFIWAYNNDSATWAYHTSRGNAQFDVLHPETAAPTNAPTDAPTNAPTDAPTNAPTNAPTSGPTPIGPATGGVQLDPVLSMTTTYYPGSQSVSFVLTSTKNGWLALGVSTDGSMDSGGNGSDVIGCTNGTVMRYVVKVHDVPTGGVIYGNGSCTQKDGQSILQFTRNIAAQKPGEQPINIMGTTNFIWAYNVNVTSLTEYHSNRGSIKYDVGHPQTMAPTPVTAAPTLSPTPALPVEGGIQFDPVLSMRTFYSAAAQSVEFFLTSTNVGWFAVGVSTDGSMDSGGNGSDVIGCSNGTVLRYVVPKHEAPTGGLPVKNSSCTQQDGKSVMHFVRNVTIQKPGELPINPTGPTKFIWAWNKNVTTLNMYHDNRGSVSYDISHPVTLAPTAMTSAPTPNVPITGTIQFDEVLSMATELEVGFQTISIVVMSTKPGWFAVGISTDGSMTSNGNGSDVIACSNNTVLRFNIKAHSTPTGGVIVPNATCLQQPTMSVMKFSRKVAATSPSELPISVTSPTTFIWAYHTDRAIIDQPHTKKGSVDYNVAAPPTLAPTGGTPAPTAAGYMPIDSLMSALVSLSPDQSKITFTVTAKILGWIGLGVNPAGLMIPADSIVCSQGVVKRYWVTARNLDAFGAGEPVPNSSCTQQNGLSTMTFTRDIASHGDKQYPISLTGDTSFVFAYNQGEIALNRHTDKGRVEYNVVSGHAGTGGIPAQATLWLHMLGMLIGWGALLPFGVSFARYMKMHPDQSLWFRVHRICQFIGWGSQLFGFVFAIIYVATSGGGDHFSGSYIWHKIIGLVAVIFGTLQPVNAFFRPHAHGNIDHTRGCSDRRTCWERLHKTCGMIGIALGAFNVFSGCYVAAKKQYDAIFVYIPLVVGGITIGSMLLFALYKEICGKGKEDPRPVVGQPERSRKNSEMAGDLKAQLIADSR